MHKKGFTIIEAVFTMAIYSLLMTIVFGVWTEFQKSFLKNEGKQDTNIKFIATYKNIDKYLSSSTMRLFKCFSEITVNNIEDTSYDTDYFNGTYKNRRWFAFLVSRSNNQLDGNLVYKNIPKVPQGSVASPTPEYMTERLIYNTCILYLLYYKSGCCGGFEFCPHKCLYRYVFKTDYEIYFGYDYDVNYTNPTSADEDSAHYCSAMTKFKNEIDNKIKLILQNPLSNSVAPLSVVERDLVDLKIEKTNERVKFDLICLRINDAERHFKFGTNHRLTNLNSSAELNYDNEVKKYIETLSWVTIPRNTVNN